MTNQITHFVLYVFEMEMMMFLTGSRKISCQNNFFVKTLRKNYGTSLKAEAIEMQVLPHPWL